VFVRRASNGTLTGAPSGVRANCGDWLWRQHPVELAARRDVELGEDLVEVISDGPGAYKQPGANLGVGEAVAGEPRDLGLLSREIPSGLDDAFADPLAGRNSSRSAR
jgi:hypothetical protein